MVTLRDFFDFITTLQEEGRLSESFARQMRSSVRRILECYAQETRWDEIEADESVIAESVNRFLTLTDACTPITRAEYVRRLNKAWSLFQDRLLSHTGDAHWYTFPLSRGRWVRLMLPSDLSPKEAEQLGQYLVTLGAQASQSPLRQPA